MTVALAQPPRGTAWLIGALVAVALFGNYYVYDSIGPVADLLQSQRGFSDSQVGLLNAIYSLPNIVLILVGGVLVDRFGAARMTLVTAAICLAGAVLTAFSPNFFAQYFWLSTVYLKSGTGSAKLMMPTSAPGGSCLAAALTCS